MASLHVVRNGCAPATSCSQLLVVEPANFPDAFLKVSTRGGGVMAIRLRELPVGGMQSYPTVGGGRHGIAMLRNLPRRVDPTTSGEPVTRTPRDAGPHDSSRLLGRLNVCGSRAT
jgi:hypothetical protein